MNTNNSLTIPSIKEASKTNEIVGIPQTNVEAPSGETKRKKRKTGKVITLDEEPDISFEIDDSQPDEAPSSSPISSSSPKNDNKSNEDDLPEEQSGNITF